MASQPTMCRFENTPTRTVLYRIAQAFVEVFIASYKKPPAEPGQRRTEPDLSEPARLCKFHDMQGLRSGG